MSRVLAVLRRYYLVSLAATIAAFGGVLLFKGPAATVTLLMLFALGVGFSIDNVVINAELLRRLSHRWQRRFMTWGSLFDVITMRGLAPVLIVALASGLGLSELLQFASRQMSLDIGGLDTLRAKLAVLGGTYLCLVFVTFMIQERDLLWLRPIERFLGRARQLESFPYIVAVAILMVMGQVRHDSSVLPYGLAAIVLFWLTRLGSETSSLPRVGLTGIAAILTATRLEIQNASLSLDDTLGSYAITGDLGLIILGLTVAVLWIRAGTLHVVEAGGLDDLRFIEHGVHWAIGSLSACMLASFFVDLPQWLPGAAACGFIGAALLHSKFASRRDRELRRDAAA